MSLAPPKPDPAAAVSLSAAQALWPQPALRVVPTNFRTFRSLTCPNGKVSAFRTQVALSFEYEG
jgi:hypothetical protein